MSAQVVKDQIIEKLDKLSENQLLEVLHGVEKIHDITIPFEGYDESKDVMVTGLFEGPTDLAERVEEFLEEGFDPHSGWTQKPKR